MGDATKLDLEAWDRDMRINVTSMVLMARHCIPEMVSAVVLEGGSLQDSLLILTAKEGPRRNREHVLRERS